LKQVVPGIGILIFILTGLICCNNSESNISAPVATDTQLPIQLGMTKEVIVSTVTLYDSVQLDSDLWQLDGNLGDIGGRWTISFANNKVSWFAFSSFDHYINENEFTDTLSRIQEVVELYSKFLGNPRRVITGITTYKDPYTHQHQGYQVFQAQWEANGSRVVVDFSFVGEGRDYGFLVTFQGS
jgi:hypothetical protein